jgi:hypothetical protein
MVVFVHTLAGTLGQTGAARSHRPNPKPARSQNPKAATSYSMVPEVTPCSSGTSPLPRAEAFPGEANTLLSALNAALRRALTSQFAVPGRT